MDIHYYKQYEPLFGSWTIEREIGEGSYGKVFEITRRDFGVTYRAALKAITIPKSKSEWKSALSEGMDEASATAYFRGIVEALTKEFALMNRLKGNSYIVSYEDHLVIEHGDKKGWDVLIRMELLEPLADYLQRAKMTERDAARLGIDLCKGLELCKQHQIIHRDIKPENIFRSGAGTFKLGDFGIARVAEKTTGASTRAGTTAFMAPEIYRGERYTDSVDIYSLGLVLYRLTNGNRLPFLPHAPAPITHVAREEAMAKRLQGEQIPQPLFAGRELSAVILKACAFRPEDRYTSAAELRTALEKALGMTGKAQGSADPVSGKQEQPLQPQNDRTELLFATPANGAAQPAMAYETSRFEKIRAEAGRKEDSEETVLLRESSSPEAVPDRPVPQEKKSRTPLWVGIGVAAVAAVVLIALLATGVFSSDTSTGGASSAVAMVSESGSGTGRSTGTSPSAGNSTSVATGNSASEATKEDSSGSLIAEESEMIFITSVEERYAEVITEGVNVRESAESQSPVITSLGRGTRVVVFARASRSGSDEVWYKVRYDENDPSKAGFVRADMLSLGEAIPAADTKEAEIDDHLEKLQGVWTSGGSSGSISWVIEGRNVRQYENMPNANGEGFSGVYALTEEMEIESVDPDTGRWSGLFLVRLKNIETYYAYVDDASGLILLECHWDPDGYSVSGSMYKDDTKRAEDFP